MTKIAVTMSRSIANATPRLTKPAYGTASVRAARCVQARGLRSSAPSAW